MIRGSSILLTVFVVLATVFLHAPAAAKSEEDVIVLRPGNSKVFGFRRPSVPAGELLEGTKITRLVDITNISVAPPGAKKKKKTKKGKSARTLDTDALVEVQAKKTRGGLKVNSVQIVAGAGIGSAEFRLRYTLGGKDHITRLRVRVKE